MIRTALFITLAAFAATGEEDAKSTAARFLAEGNAAFADGRTLDALDKYRAAHAAYPSPKIQMNIGEAHLALRQYVEAQAAFLEVVDGLPGTSPVHVAARQRLEELDAHVGRLTVTSVPDASLRVDDGEPTKTPLVGAPIEAGTHRLELSAPTHVTAVESVTIEGGRTSTVAVKLVPEIVPPRAEPEPEGEGLAWWVWAGVGVAAAATVATIFVVASGSGDDFTPGGELGRSSLDDWGMR